jgi:hypothetical protein
MSLTLATQTLKGRLIAPHQHAGVRWMLDRETAQYTKGGILADSMGVGKTIQVIATILGNPGLKTLIVVPKSIVHQWAEEIKKFAPSLSVHIFDGPKRILVPSNVVIAPYSVLVPKSKPAGTPTVLHNETWGRVVLDEGHDIRNIRSKIFVACKNLVAPVRWILTGTPIYNNIRDFVALCDFIGISRCMVQGIPTQIRDTYVLRRTMDTEGSSSITATNKRLELPPCDFQNVELDFFSEELDLYRKVFEQSRNRVDELMAREDAGMMYMHMLEAFLRVRQVMIHPQLYLNGMARKLGIEPEEWVRIEFLIKWGRGLTTLLAGPPHKQDADFVRHDTGSPKGKDPDLLQLHG